MSSLLREVMIMTKVLLPKWWADGEDIIGLTDCIDEYCCCSTPAWFVEVPTFEYEGYFSKYDLTVIPD